MKRPVKIPAIYAGLTTTREGTELCVVIDKQGAVFKFDSPSKVMIVKEAIVYMWGNFDQFDDWADKNHSQFTNIHSQVFKSAVPKTTDVIIARVYLWKKLLEGATNRTTAGDPTRQATSHVPGRRSSIGTRMYEVIQGAPACPIHTYQAVACYKIIVEEARPTKVGEHVDTVTKEAVPTIKYLISEADLRDRVIARAAELKTKQDPWRIFQYYRPQLIAAKLIRHD